MLTTGLQGLTRAFGDMLPNEDILERSEFLLPLDEATRRLYWDVLHPELPVAKPYVTEAGMHAQPGSSV